MEKTLEKKKMLVGSLVVLLFPHFFQKLFFFFRLFKTLNCVVKHEKVVYFYNYPMAFAVYTFQALSQTSPGFLVSAEQVF